MKEAIYKAPAASLHNKLHNERIIARSKTKQVLLIMLIPALYNFICFNFPQNSSMPLLFAVFNGIGLLMLLITAWFFSLHILEFACSALNIAFGQQNKTRSWKNALYNSLKITPRLAAAGALLWLAWAYGFYQLAMPFYSISIPALITGNVLAAVWYLPLIFHWRRIETMEVLAEIE